MLTQEYLKSKYDYHEDGWLVYINTGRICGTFKGRYVKIIIKAKEYYLHQLIWLWHFGYIPNRIDHWDGNGFNNKVENLREATQSQNSANADHGPDRGIERHGNKFRVRLWKDGIRIQAGSCDTLEEARALRDQWLNFHFGEFSFNNRPNA